MKKAPTPTKKKTVTASIETPYLTIEPSGETITLKVLIQPRASKNEVKGTQDGRLKIRLKAAPVEGEANKALIAYMAKLLGIKKVDIEITAGLASRRKTLNLQGLSCKEASNALREDRP